MAGVGGARSVFVVPCCGACCCASAADAGLWLGTRASARDLTRPRWCVANVSAEEAALRQVDKLSAQVAHMRDQIEGLQGELRYALSMRNHRKQGDHQDRNHRRQGEHQNSFRGLDIQSGEYQGEVLTLQPAPHGRSFSDDFVPTLGDLRPENMHEPPVAAASERAQRNEHMHEPPLGGHLASVALRERARIQAALLNASCEEPSSAHAPAAMGAALGSASVAALSGLISDFNRRQRVLVMDEDRGLCKVVGKLLSKDMPDLDVDAAHDAEAALKLLANASSDSPGGGGRFDLVLIKGPEIAGTPTVNFVRSFREVYEGHGAGAQAGRAVQFVAVVKTAEEADALDAHGWAELAGGGKEGGGETEGGRGAGRGRILMKPVNREALCALVRAALPGIAGSSDEECVEECVDTGHCEDNVAHPGAAVVAGDLAAHVAAASESAPGDELVVIKDDRRQRVLVMDEDRGLCKVVGKLLSKDMPDLDVDAAHDAEAALKLLANASSDSPGGGGRFDLVLIKGPEIAGTPTVNFVRSFREVYEGHGAGAQAGRAVQFVAVVKTAEEADALDAHGWAELAGGGKEGGGETEGGRGAGRGRILMKPVNREALCALVRAALPGIAGSSDDECAECVEEGTLVTGPRPGPPGMDTVS